jgi:NADH-quinone oxidoreductase subunit N
MTYGNITAMRQSNVKRLLAYSSIAHAGYMLMGLAALFAVSKGYPDMIGIDAIIFYLITYLIMTLGAFGFVMYLSNRYGKEEIDGYAGLGWKSPYASTFMCAFLLSLTGVPPTVGFIGKFKLFNAVLDEGLYWLAVVAAINAVIALFYYFRIVKALFFKTVAEGTEEQEGSLGGPAQGVVIAVLAILCVATIYYGLSWSSLNTFAAAALP